VSAGSLSLPRAERGISLLALLVAPALAALAAASPRAAVYAVLAAVAVFIVFKSLLGGLALFAVLTFPDRLPGALGIGPTLAKPLGIVILISWLLTIAGDRERQIPFLPRDAPLLTYALLSLLVWCTATLVWASDRSAVLDNVSRLAQLVSLVFITYSAVRKPRDLLVVGWALLIGALVTSVFALANGTLNAGRLTGGIFNPNAFAVEMVIALVIAMFLLVSTQHIWLRLLLLALLVPLAVAFVETQSRSGVVALVAALLVAIIVGGPWRGRVTAVILLAAALGLAYYVYAAPPELRERVTSIGSGTSQASPLRADTWQIALRVTRDHPILGVGLGNFPDVESRYVTADVNIVQVGTLRRLELVVHNTYLEILAELGLVGLILFAAVLTMTIGRALAMLARGGSEAGGRLLARAIVAATAGVMTAQIFNSGEYSKQLWLLLGLAVAAASLGSEARLQSSRAPGDRSAWLAHVPAA
jgi:O-antigen ligase